MPAFNVQSIDGFLLRLETGPHELREWTPLATPLWHKVSRSILLAAILGSSFWAIYRMSRPLDQPEPAAPTSRDYLEFALVLTLAIVTSPVSWSHYYALLLLPWGLYLGGRLPLSDDAMTRWLIHGGFVLSALPVIMLPLGADLGRSGRVADHRLRLAVRRPVDAGGARSRCLADADEPAGHWFAPCRPVVMGGLP